jgi:hypothetical protein
MGQGSPMVEMKSGFHPTEEQVHRVKSRPTRSEIRTRFGTHIRKAGQRKKSHSLLSK